MVKSPDTWIFSKLSCFCWVQVKFYYCVKTPELTDLEVLKFSLAEQASYLKGQLQLSLISIGSLQQ